MEAIFPFLIGLLFMSAIAETAECENGWVAHKDEFCIKLFPTRFVNYYEAESFCSSQGSGASIASLVLVKDSQLQDLLATYTSDAYDYIWLGARYDSIINQFKWADGTPLAYTNWQEGYPRNVTGSDSCIELRPVNAKSSITSAGKWADVTCQKRNLVMCQRPLAWTLQDAIDEIIKIRKQLDAATEERNELRDSDRLLRNELQVVSLRVVPVGSIYIEYFGQPTPRSLWPNLTWQDISSTYAGLFFRTSGGGSEEWGIIQPECAPRITQMQGKLFFGENPNLPNPINIPASGWSVWGYSGEHGRGAEQDHDDAIRFHTEYCEVRPKNQAIRVWKRTA